MERDEMHKRPKPGETEEDLLEFQRQFLAQQCNPSASVVTSKHVGDKRSFRDVKAEETKKDVVHMAEFPKTLPVSESAPSGPKKSRFKAAQEKVKSKSQEMGLPMDSVELIDEHDRSTATVLTKIIERDTHNAFYSLPAPVSLPFPAVSEVSPNTQQKTQKKKSLFAQQYEATTGVVRDTEEVEHTAVKSDSRSGEVYPTIVDGSGLSATFGRSEAHKIHEENLSKLSGMSQEEILVEQRKLLDTLDPKLVEFLRSRKQVKGQESSGESRLSAETLSPKIKQKDSKVKQDSEVPLPVEVKKEWVNMDKIEYDKLEWMKDLPPPSADNKAGQQARFDFHGDLIQADADIPVNVGLHHHGDEPERAGYTLEEMFTLARSSNMQQRVLALTTLSRVITQTREGKLAALVQTPILPCIIDAGVIFLLRWSLDDGVESVMAASVAALNALLVNHADELAIGKAFHWYHGHRVACQAPAKPAEVGIKLPGESDEKPQQTDAEVAKDDLISALVTRMNLLQRLFYILKTVQPQAPTVIGILQILTKVSRHSTQLAYQVFSCKGLLELVISEFFPLSWKSVGKDAVISHVYGIPLKEAVTLVRTLCQAGRNMASILLYKFGLQDRLRRFLLADPESIEVTGTENGGVIMECLNTWKVCLSYGLADTVYIDCYASFVDMLRKIGGVTDQPIIDQYRISALVSCLETAVCVATIHRKPHAFSHSKDGKSMEVERSEDVAMPTITWSHVADLIHPVRTLLSSLLSDIASSYQMKKQSLQVPTACLNFVTTYFIHSQTQLHGAEMIECLQMMEEVYQDCIQHWNSIGMITIVSKLSQHSNLLQPVEERNLEQHSCLPDYGNSSVQEDQLLPILRPESPYGFLEAWYRLVYKFAKIHRGLQSSVTSTNLPSPLTVLQSHDLWTYLRKIATRKLGHLVHNYFSKHETLLLYQVLKLLALLASGECDLDLMTAHHVSLKLLTSIHAGDEHIVHDLLSTVTFNPIFFRTDISEEAVNRLKDLSLALPTHIHSATQEEMVIVTEHLVSEARNNLTSIRASYLAAFGHSEQLVLSSRNHYVGRTTCTENCFTFSMGESVLPADWMFAPLIELYNTFSSVGAEVQNALSTSQLDTVRNVLRWIFLMESQRAVLLERISITLKLSRIMCVFLTGNDMFLDRTVHCFLAGLLRSYMKPSVQSKIDFSEHIPGLPSFYDLFVALLQQYEAVSFGDSLFACYILIPLQQRHSVQYRKAIFTEYTGIQRTLSLSLKELLLPVETYLEPEESNIELLRLYYQSLYGGTLQPKWCPVLYLVAVHHVNRFMFTQDKAHKKLKDSMMVAVLKSSNQVLRNHLVMYKQADISKEYGMELYPELPHIRQSYIDSLQPTG